MWPAGRICGRPALPSNHAHRANITKNHGRDEIRSSVRFQNEDRCCCCRCFPTRCRQLLLPHVPSHTLEGFPKKEASNERYVHANQGNNIRKPESSKPWGGNQRTFRQRAVACVPRWGLAKTVRSVKNSGGATQAAAHWLTGGSHAAATATGRARPGCRSRSRALTAAGCCALHPAPLETQFGRTLVVVPPAAVAAAAGAAAAPRGLRLGCAGALCISYFSLLSSP